MQNVVIGIFGFKGGGKTLLGAYLAYIDMLLGKKILTNLKGLGFPSDIVDPKQLIDLDKSLEGCTLLIDELHTLADSRKSSKVQNINIANFVLQSRHRGVNVIFTDQFQGQCEKRIRDNTDIKIIAKNMFMDTDEDGFDDLFEYTIIDVRKETIDKIFLYGKPIFDLYSTAEIVDIYEYQKQK